MGSYLGDGRCRRFHYTFVHFENIIIHDARFSWFSQRVLCLKNGLVIPLSLALNRHPMLTLRREVEELECTKHAELIMAANSEEVVEENGLRKMICKNCISTLRTRLKPRFDG